MKKKHRNSKGAAKRTGEARFAAARGSASSWTWKEVAKELLAQGQRLRARLEIQGQYSEGWDVVASFAGKKLSKRKTQNGELSDRASKT